MSGAPTSGWQTPQRNQVFELPVRLLWRRSPIQPEAGHHLAVATDDGALGPTEAAAATFGAPAGYIGSLPCRWTYVITTLTGSILRRRVGHSVTAIADEFIKRHHEKRLQVSCRLELCECRDDRFDLGAAGVVRVHVGEPHDASRSTTSTVAVGSSVAPSALPSRMSTPSARWAWSTSSACSNATPNRRATRAPASDRTENWRLCLSALLSDSSGVWGLIAAIRAPNRESCGTSSA